MCLKNAAAQHKYANNGVNKDFAFHLTRLKVTTEQQPVEAVGA